MNTQLILLIAIILINIIAIGFTLMIIFPIKKTKELNTVKKESKTFKEKPTPHTFEVDIQYLLFLLDYSCSVSLSTKLRPKQQSNKGMNIINDEIFVSVVSETSLSILSKLSPAYRDLLSYYMPDVANVVTEMTHNKLIEMTTGLNRETINLINQR